MKKKSLFLVMDFACFMFLRSLKAVGKKRARTGYKIFVGKT